MVLSLSLNLLSRALALLLLLFGTAPAEGRRVSLEDLPSFLAELGKLTSGRKSARAPQMKCDGGSAGCGYAVQPRAVECVNLATTPPDAASWQCRQMQVMSPHFQMTDIRVSCEGYENQDDLHVLHGSCGVEYRLEVVVGGNSTGYMRALYYTRSHGFPAWKWSSLAAMAVTLLVTASIGYGLLTGRSPDSKPIKNISFYNSLSLV